MFFTGSFQLNTMWNQNEPSKNIWRTRDVAEMAAAIKTAPIFIDEVKSNFYSFVESLRLFQVSTIYFNNSSLDTSLSL